MNTYTCQECSVEFKSWPSQRRGVTHYCSVECKNKSTLWGKIVSEKRKGIIFSDEHKKNLRLSHIGVQKADKNAQWKGELVGYCALHSWVSRTLGKPDVCEACGETGLSGRWIHWSNISGKYKRSVDDWQRLCAKCHKNYDLNKITICV